MNPIEVDGEVYYQIKKRADLGLDTPNSVLRRVFGLACEPDTLNVANDEPPSFHRFPPNHRPTKRAPTEQLIPVSDYSYPIVDAVAELGGDAERDEVLERVRWKVEPIIKPMDLEPMMSGEPRWRLRAIRCKTERLSGRCLTIDAPIGYWRLTDEGWRAHRREVELGWRMYGR